MPRKSGAFEFLYSVSLSDALTGWAVGDDGTILWTQDGGGTWSHRPLPLPPLPGATEDWFVQPIQTATQASEIRLALEDWPFGLDDEDLDA